MRISFVWDWNNDPYQMITWKDGLSAAMKILSERHEVSFFTCGKTTSAIEHPFFVFNMCLSGAPLVDSVRASRPDVILHFADATRPNAAPLSQLGIPMALCFAGGNVNGETQKYFDHFFVESQSYFDRFSAAGCSVSTAFGTNDELFTPRPSPKLFDVIFPATYCEWKRHDLLVAALAGRGLRAVCAGYQYEKHERWCWEDCKKNGILTLPHVSAETLRSLYEASRVCVIPSRTDGGSQRTVLEAMSMNVPVVVCSDSDKTSEYVADASRSNFYTGEVVDPTPDAIADGIAKTLMVPTSQGRDYIKSKWMAAHYANAIEDGLKKLIA